MTSCCAGGPSVARADFSAVSLPRNWPNTCTVGPPGPVERRQRLPSASGAAGAQRRKLASTASTCAQGHVAMKYEPWETAWVRKTSCVTIAEIAASTAAAGPEEVAVVRRVGRQELAVGGDDLQGTEVVGGKAPGA